MTNHRLEVADVLRQHKQEFLARWGHSLYSQQRKALREICVCRTPALGARFQQCDQCGYQSLAFQSCRNPHCPKWQSTARDRWLTKTASELLPVSYSNVIFTLPSAITAGSSEPHARLQPALPLCGGTLLNLARDPHRLGAELGCLAVLHTWSQKLLHHPHLHCLVPTGGLSRDRTRWLPCRKGFFLPGKVLGRLFRGKFLAALAIAFRRRQLHLSGPLQSLQRPEAFDRFLRPLKKLDWVVELRPPIEGRHPELQHLARHTHRVVISNGRLVSLQQGKVAFRWRDSADHNTQKLMTMEAVEFMRRFLLHVLPQGLVKIRHFGFLANCRRAEALKLCRTLLQAAAPSDLLTDGQKRAVEHVCRSCRKGTLCFLAHFSPDLLQALKVTTIWDSS